MIAPWWRKGDQEGGKMAKQKQRAIYVGMDDRLYALLRRDARHAARSISQWVRYLLLEYYRQRGEWDGEEQDADREASEEGER
jgi:hypothetical protein